MRLAIAALTMVCLAGAAGLESEVEKAERDFAAAVSRSDAAALEKALAADLVYTHSTGSRDTRESYIGKISKGQMKYEKWDIEKLEVRKVSGDVAVVTSVAAVRTASGGPANDARLSILHVFARRQGRWQLVAHQSARLP